MKAPTYKQKIVEACQKAGTYQECFDECITTLSTILERRDDADKLFKDSGGNAIITHTNKAGAPNPVKNPALVLWDDLNKTALAYWRDLGLTPSGLRRINEDAMKPRKKDKLTEALAELGKEL